MLGLYIFNLGCTETSMLAGATTFQYLMYNCEVRSLVFYFQLCLHTPKDFIVVQCVGLFHRGFLSSQPFALADETDNSSVPNTDRHSDSCLSLEGLQTYYLLSLILCV